MRFNTSRWVALIGITSAGLFIGQELTAQTTYYYGPNNSYGAFTGGNYVSEYDADRAARKAERQQKRDDAKERMEKKAEESRARARATPEPYVPKPPKQKVITPAHPHIHVTADRRNGTLLGGSPITATPVTGAPQVHEGKELIVVNDEYYFYSDGEFFVENGDSLLTVDAPKGALLFELPDGTTTKSDGGKNYYEYKGVRYQRVMKAGKALFEVVGKA